MRAYAACMQASYMHAPCRHQPRDRVRGRSARVALARLGGPVQGLGGLKSRARRGAAGAAAVVAAVTPCMPVRCYAHIAYAMGAAGAAPAVHLVVGLSAH